MDWVVEEDHYFGLHFNQICLIWISFLWGREKGSANSTKPRFLKEMELENDFAELANRIINEIR